MPHPGTQQLYQLPVGSSSLSFAYFLRSSFSTVLLALAIDVEGTTVGNVPLGFGNASFLLE